MKSIAYHNAFSGLALIIAPLSFGSSTFFWNNGEFGVKGGSILALSLVFWILAFIILFDKLKEPMPLYTMIGLPLAIYGCMGGASFGLVDVFLSVFGISRETYLSVASDHSLSFNLLLFWPGPLFPLSLIVLGVNLSRKKIIPVWTGILICLGGLAFPASRISRMEMVAHVSDLLLGVPMVYLGLKYFFNKAEQHSQV